MTALHCRSSNRQEQDPGGICSSGETSGDREGTGGQGRRGEDSPFELTNVELGGTSIEEGIRVDWRSSAAD